MKIYIFFIFIIILNSCTKYEQPQDKISDNENINLYNYDIPPPVIIEADISDFYIGKDITEYNIISHHSILVDSNDINPYFLVLDNDIKYLIAYSKISNIIKYIIVDKSNENKFKTPEGIYIGMTYSELIKIFPEINLHARIGLGYYGQLPSGWKIGFFIGKNLTEHHPKDEDRILIIFLGGHDYKN